MTIRQAIYLLPVLFSILFLNPQPGAGSNVRVEVMTILASDEGREIDARLKDLVRELQSVFRYSSYQLLGRNSLNLAPDRPEKISLPGGRTMNLTLKGISGNRATLQLEIFRGNNHLFQSVIQLRNRSSVTVGGPKHQGGYLLFNIFNSF